MKPLIVVPEADQDLSDIANHVAETRPIRALKLLDEFYAMFDKIEQWPYIGFIHSDMGDGIRGFPLYDFMIFYRIDQDAIRVLRVLDGARDIGPEFFEE